MLFWGWRGLHSHDTCLSIVTIPFSQTCVKPLLMYRPPGHEVAWKERNGDLDQMGLRSQDLTARYKVPTPNGKNICSSPSFFGKQWMIVERSSRDKVGGSASLPRVLDPGEPGLGRGRRMVGFTCMLAGSRNVNPPSPPPSFFSSVYFALHTSHSLFASPCLAPVSPNIHRKRNQHLDHRKHERQDGQRPAFPGPEAGNVGLPVSQPWYPSNACSLSCENGFTVV